MFKYIVRVLIGFVLFGYQALFAQEVELKIRYYDQQIYTAGAPIRVLIEIRNNSAEPFRFKLADRRLFNIEFITTTLSNVMLEHSDQFIIEHASVQQTFFREMSLQPGEAFNFIENLLDYTLIDAVGNYIVSAKFYPELYAQAESGGLERAFLVSNALPLNIRPPTPVVGGQTLYSVQVTELLSAEDLPPDQVIDYVIDARKRESWDKFFLYFDLEAFFLRVSGNIQPYTLATDQEKQTMLINFRDSLKNGLAEHEVITIPREYEIIKTSYTFNQGTVEAILKFRYSDFTEIKKYTYFLHRVGGIWKIYNYEVQNQGTE